MVRFMVRGPSWVADACVPSISPWLLGVQEMGGTTAEIMGHLIMQRADRMAISITVNSIGTPLNEVPPSSVCYLPPSSLPHPTLPCPQPSMRSTRQRLYPSIGYLYPAGTDRLANTTDESLIESALSVVPEYQKLYSSVTVRLPECSVRERERCTCGAQSPVDPVRSNHCGPWAES